MKSVMGSSLKVCVLSWNMANTVVSKEDVINLAKQLKSADVILVEGQEETIEEKKALAKLLQEALPDQSFSLVANTAFKVQTSFFKPGRVSSSVLMKQGVHCKTSHEGIYRERDEGALLRNKGGIVNRYTFYKEQLSYKLNVVSAHLASRSDAKKINEAGCLLKLLEGGGAISFSKLSQLSADLDIFSGDLNYRNIYKHEKLKLSPFDITNPDCPAVHFYMRGFELPQYNNLADSYTYAGKGFKKLSNASVNLRGTRRVGVTGDFYCQGGFLDLVLHRGGQAVPHKFNVVEKIESKHVDHRPVIATFELTSSEDKFARTIKWVANLLGAIKNEGMLINEEIFHKIQQANDNAASKEYISDCYNYFISVANLQVHGEYFRARRDLALRAALNGKKGLVNELLAAGNDYFLGERNSNDFFTKVNEIIQEAYKNNPRLKEIDSLWSKLRNILLLIFSIRNKRVVSETEEKVEAVIRCCRTLFDRKKFSSEARSSSLVSNPCLIV